MKKIASVLLASFVVVLSAACGDDDTGSSSGSSSTCNPAGNYEYKITYAGTGGCARSPRP